MSSQEFKNPTKFGTMLRLHKKTFNQDTGEEIISDYGIPVNTIVAIDISRSDGSTLLRTPTGSVCIAESFDEVVSKYNAEILRMAKIVK